MAYKAKEEFESVLQTNFQFEMHNLNNDLGHTGDALQKDCKNCSMPRNIYIRRKKKTKQKLLSDFLRTEKKHLPELCSNEEP